jgi:hypothetical protein
VLFIYIYFWSDGDDPRYDMVTVRLADHHMVAN